MEIVKVLPLDLRAELASNYIDETQPVTILSRDWYRPDYSPFYVDDFELYDGEGMLLKHNVHYTFESLNQEMLDKTGRRVYQFFRIKDITLNYKKSYRIKYRSIGNTGFPRSLIGKMVNDLVNSDYWVDWDTQVLGKPPTMPAYQHWHDVATEVANWDQFIDFAKQHLNFVMETKRNHYDRTMAMINQVEGLFSKEHKDYRARLKEHDQNYNNPHKLTREHFELGEIPNLPLATPKEDYQGGAPNRFTTPKGLAIAVRDRQRMSPTLVRSGELKVNALHELGGLSTVAPARTFNIGKLIRASVVRHGMDGINFYVGDASGMPSTSLYAKDGELTLTGKLNTIFNDVPKFDVVLRCVGDGVVLTQSTSKVGRYYPNPNDFLDPNSSDYYSLDLTLLASHFGANWENSCWFIPIKGGLLVVHHNATLPTKPFLMDFRMFTFNTNTGPAPTYSPTTFTFDYESATGVDIKDATRMSFVEVLEGSVSGTFTRYHHEFTTPIKVAALAGHGMAIIADNNPNNPDLTMIKILASATLDGKDYPIEMAWEFDNKERRFSRMESGSNVRLVDNAANAPEFSKHMVKLTKGGYIYPTLGYANDGSIVNYFGNGKYTAGKVECKNFIEFYRTSIEHKLSTEVVSKDLTVGLVVPSAPDSFNWTVVVPNDCEIIYNGTRKILKAGMLDVRTMIGWTSGVNTVRLSVYSASDGLRLTVNGSRMKGAFQIATIEADSTGIIKFTKVTGV
ncbi:minor tail protein [Vibrio phage phiKT1019]|nr:minor tail protein [Vibrio phage phiKT1019]